jgi:hypothetical protein
MERNLFRTNDKRHKKNSFSGGNKEKTHRTLLQKEERGQEVLSIFLFHSILSLKKSQPNICCLNRRVYARKCLAFFDVFENEMEEIKMSPPLSPQCFVKWRN